MRTLQFLLFTALLLAGCHSSTNEKAANPDIYYTCSMDPQVIEHEPGLCPICHMELTPVKKSMADKEGQVRLSEEQIKLGNVTTDTVRAGGVAQRASFSGALGLDQDNVTVVAARVGGRIERLYHKSIGEQVRKGEPLFDIYSESMNLSKQEYRSAAQTAGSSSTDTLVLHASAERLKLWGMSNAQITALATSASIPVNTTILSPASGIITSLDVLEGGQVMDGGAVVEIADLSSLWVEADVLWNGPENASKDAEAEVTLPDRPGYSFKGRIELVRPEVAMGSRLTRIRLRVPNPKGDLMPGLPATVHLIGESDDGLSLPTDAVIRDGKGASVWVLHAPGTYMNRMVMTGTEAGGRIAITDGLKEGEAVVVTGAYLINSEYIFKHGADPMAGMAM
ncbi:MAG: efflux RND transporter periplasmic adaptor subunit [Flavobacteriales bacterium]